MSRTLLDSADLIRRLWDKDASLWTEDAAAQAAIRHRLGWLTIASVMEPHVPAIESFAQEIARAGFTHALLLGMGGSSLFSEVCRHTFGAAPGKLDLLVLDTTDPTAIQTAMARAPLERTLFIVSSKSGSTIESSALCSYFYDRCGKRAGQQFVAITDAGTPLEAQAKAQQFRRAFVHGPAIGQDVGGRFSALTYFGLVPAALMGVDVRALLASARAMGVACQPTAPVADNPAVQLGAWLGEAYAAGRDKVTLLFSPSLASFGVWVEQLIAESTGKSGKGLVPVYGEPPRAAAAYGSDRGFLSIELESEADPERDRFLAAVAQAGHPVMRLRWCDRHELGGETIRWFLATAMAASIMRLNPFDEPNVQESKDRTKALLEHYAKAGKLPEEATTTIDEQRLNAWLSQAQPGDYVAVLSFLPRTPELDRAVERVRDGVAERSSLATTLGYGPRYLHSTGQLHKGGSDHGLFLLLTADDPVDLPVPGAPYSFSVLKRAQALGDLQALRARNRRVLHLHLGSSPLDALKRLST